MGRSVRLLFAAFAIAALSGGTVKDFTSPLFPDSRNILTNHIEVGGRTYLITSGEALNARRAGVYVKVRRVWYR